MVVEYLPSARALVRCMFDGVCDSLRLPSTLIFFLSSTTVRVRTAHCLLLNGLIFLGSILLADYVWAPLVRAILELSVGGGGGGAAAEANSLAAASIALPSHDSGLAAWIHVLFLYAYQLLWIYPLYALSFILNAIWYQDIADHAFATHGGTAGSGAVKQGTSFQKWVGTMSDEVYRLLLVSAFMLQLTAVSFVPVIGNALVVIHLCWMYSLYSFEYKWSLLGWSLEYRLKYFEKHWAYFLGFGLPAVTLSLIFPKFISLGIFALAFPIFIILAIIAHPTKHVPRQRKSSHGALASSDAPSGLPPPPASAPPVLLPQLPIFRAATWLNWWLLQKASARARVGASSHAAPRAAPAPTATAGSKALAPAAGS